MICNTMIHHELASSAYNQRRAECEEGVRILSRSMDGIRALRDVTIADLERHKDELSSVVYRRCRHVVSENARVLEAAQRLQDAQLEQFGALMYDSHRSLRDDYEATCGELDLMVDGFPDVVEQATKLGRLDVRADLGGNHRGQPTRL